MKNQPARGTRDIWGKEFSHFIKVQSKAWEIAERFGFQGIETPIFEFTEVFLKNLGDASDIVNKEMYTFSDRGGDSLTLRPEGTASTVRAIISEGLTRETPLKFYYQGPMFRYERPQKGRYRQFYQIGVEFIGSNEPLADVEVLSLSYDFLSELGLKKIIELKINTIGDKESRDNYRTELVKFLTPQKNKLSEDSQRRLEQNPMRILDSKDPQDKAITLNAPRPQNHLNESSKKFFDEVLNNLSKLGIPYSIDDKLVRGLDYYTHTVFEFVTESLGSQGAVLSGGRYNDLVKNMGGGDLPGVGMAAGVDRLMLLIDQLEPTSEQKILGIIPVFDADVENALLIMQKLRHSGIKCEMPLTGNISKKMKKASKNCSHALIVGGEEWTTQNIVLKNLSSGEQKTIPLNNLEINIKKEIYP